MRRRRMLPRYLHPLSSLGLHCSQQIVWRCPKMCQFFMLFVFPLLAEKNLLWVLFSVCRDGKKVCVTCCGSGKGNSTQEVGKVSLPNVTVWDLPGTDRQKGKVHMDAHANQHKHTVAKHKEEKIYCIQKDLHAGTHSSFTLTCTLLTYTHTHTHTHT